MVLVHHDPFVLTVTHRLHVDEVNFRSGTEVLRQDWFDDNSLGSSLNQALFFQLITSAS